MDIFEEYEILSVIGEGTFGVVKLGKDKKTGEEVAIKILEKQRIINEEDEERVEREIDILKRVHHINIIRIIKIEEDDENIFIIMEFCQKGELFNHIVEEQKLDEVESAYYYYQLINGLECLHYNEVVHRDLKPENLLLSKGYLLKIIDFGLSNYFDNINLLSTPCGSPCYASPEMVSGKKYNGFLIDIWSTGIILYAMLCGYLPFEDPNNDILFQKISNCEPEFPEDLSNDAIDLMQKIMVNNPDVRITIPEIKKHPFYLMGKKHFESAHPDLVNEVEIDYSKKQKDDINNEYKRDSEDEKKNEMKKDIFQKSNKKKYNPLIGIIKQINDEKSYSDYNYIYRRSESQIFDEKRFINMFQEKLSNNKNINDNNNVKNNNNKNKDNEIINIQINDIVNDNINDNNNYNNDKINNKNIDIININVNENNNGSMIDYIINNNGINTDNNKETIKDNKLLDDINESNNKNKKNDDTNNNENNNEMNYKTESNINLNPNQKNMDKITFKTEKDFNENINNNELNELNINSKQLKICNDDLKIRNDDLNINNKKDNVNDKIDKNDNNVKKESNQNEKDIINKTKDADENNSKNENIMEKMDNNSSEIKQIKNQIKDDVKKEINNNNDENKEINILKKRDSLQKKINDKIINNIANININKKKSKTKSAISDLVKLSNKNQKKLNDILKRTNYPINNLLYRNKNLTDITFNEKHKTIVNNNINNSIRINKNMQNESYTLKLNSQKNNDIDIIPYLKSKTYVEKRRSHNSKSIEPKPISKKIESIFNKRNERLKIPHSIREVENLINNNKMINYRLTEIDSNSRKENININSDKYNQSVRINTSVKPIPEIQLRKTRKNIPINSYNNGSIKTKILYQDKRTLYDNSQNIRSDSKKDNLSFNMIKLNKNIYPLDTLSNFSISIDKINNNLNYHKNNNSIGNPIINSNIITSLYQKNINISHKISDNNIKNSFQRNTTNINNKMNNNNSNYNNSYNNFNNIRYTQNTNNKNININNIYKSNYKKLNTLPNNPIFYKKKFDSNINSYQNLSNTNNTLNTNSNNKYNILRKYNLNNNIINETSEELNTIYDRNEIIKKQNDNLHKRNESNRLYINIIEKKPEQYNYKNININKNINNSPSKKNKEIISQNNRYINRSKNHNYYVTSNITNKIDNYVPNNVSIIPKRRQELSTIREKDNISNIRINILNSRKNVNLNANINKSNKNRQDINKYLELLSNSAEKYRTPNYPINSTISNIDLPVNLITSQNHFNKFVNTNNNNKRRNNQIYLSINSYDDNNEYQRKNNDNYYKNTNNIKNKNLVHYNTKNRLIKKVNIDNIDNTQGTRISNYNNRVNVKENNIFDTINKQNNKYSSNKNLNTNTKTDNEYNNYLFNKTQTNLKDLFNQRMNISINNNYNNNNNKLKSNINLNLNINNYKRNINQISFQNNGKRIDSTKIINESNNNNYIQDNVYKNSIKSSYNNINRNDINKNNDNQNKNKYIQISKNEGNKGNNKPKVRNSNPLMNLISHIKKLPINRSKQLENTNFNKTNRNVLKFNKPITNTNQDFTDHYLTNNNIN